MDADRWGMEVASWLGTAFTVAAIISAVMRKWRLAGYLAAAAYAFWWPILLWFWQFTLTGRSPVPHWYIWSAAAQIVVFGIVPLVLLTFRRFRPVVTAVFLAYVLSLVLQLFSYMYWTYGTGRNFNIPLSHLDSFYFALGTMTTAGTGDIYAISETSRRLQTFQMGVDLLLLGIVVVLVLARYSGLFARPRDGSLGGGQAAAALTPAVGTGTQPRNDSSTPNEDAAEALSSPPMTGEDTTISEAALEAVGNLLAAAKHHGIGISFEPDDQGWRVGYIEATGGGDLASAYDLETAVRAAERPLDELAHRLTGSEQS